MKTPITLFYVIALFGFTVGRAGAADATAADRKEVTVIGSLKSFSQDGYEPGWDSLVFSVEAPARLKGKKFTVLVYPRPKPRSAADRKDAEAYWRENLGRQIELTVEEEVLMLPQAAPVVFTCGKTHLRFQKPNQSLEPTAGLRPAAAHL